MTLVWSACTGDDPVLSPSTTTDDAGGPEKPDAKASGDDAALVDGGTLDSGTCDGSCAPPTCAAILAAAPSSLSGVFTIDPDGIGPEPPFKAYCDMQTDDGGWTLLISLAPTTVTNGFNAPQAWPTTVSTEPGPPTTSGLYQGTLAPFHDVRETIASGVVTVYGRNKTLAELEIIRMQYGSMSRKTSAATYANRPACRVSYDAGTDGIIGCSNATSGSSTDTSVIGWSQDADPSHTNGCWFGRGNIGSAGSDAGGSSQCNGDVNGTRWARTWFR